METPMLTPQRKGSSAWEWVVKSRQRAPHPAFRCDPCWSVVSLHGSQTYHSLRVGVLKGKFPQLSRSSKYSTILSILRWYNFFPVLSFALAVCKARVGSSGGLERNSNIKERQDFAHLENSKFQISIDFNRFQQRISTDFNEDTILGPASSCSMQQPSPWWMAHPAVDSSEFHSVNVRNGWEWS